MRKISQKQCLLHKKAKLTVFAEANVGNNSGKRSRINGFRAKTPQGPLPSNLENFLDS